MKVKHEIGTICYRCGIDRKYAKKMGYSECSSWGEHYPRHLWNDKVYTSNDFLIHEK